MIGTGATYLKMTIVFLFSAASKRTVAALARARDALLTGIHDLRELEKAHGLTNFASDFTEKNKDVLSTFSTEGFPIQDSRNAPVTPATDGNVPPTSVVQTYGHSTLTADADPASAFDAPDVTCPASGTQTSPIGSIKPSDVEHEAHETHSGGNPSAMVTEQLDGSDQQKKRKEFEPEVEDDRSTKQDGPDQQKEPEDDSGAEHAAPQTGHSSKKRSKSTERSDISTDGDSSEEDDSDDDDDSGVKNRKRKRLAKKSQGQCMFICAYIRVPGFKSDCFCS